MTRVNRFQKCGLNLNETNDGGGSADLGIAKDDWAQLRTGASYEECVSCKDDNMCKVQTLK